MHGQLALETLIKNFSFKTVLDVGAGSGVAGKNFMNHGHEVTSSDIGNFGAPNLVLGDFLEADLGTYDLVWASHVLEHQLDVHKFLKKCHSHMHEDSLLCVTVPPLKHEIVGGHVSLWNAGLLAYNLILAGFDCRGSAIKTYGYNISIICRKHPDPVPKLVYDYGDIQTLADRFPIGFNFHGFNGQIAEYNWPQ